MMVTPLWPRSEECDKVSLLSHSLDPMNELSNKALPQTCLATIGLILVTDFIFKLF